MKVYRLTVMVVDHGGVGMDGISDLIEDAKYPNWCIAPCVIKAESVDIGEWKNSSPFNNRATMNKAFDELIARGR